MREADPTITDPWVLPETKPLEPREPEHEPDLPKRNPKTVPGEEPHWDPCRCPGT